MTDDLHLSALDFEQRCAARLWSLLLPEARKRVGPLLPPAVGNGGPVAALGRQVRAALEGWAPRSSRDEDSWDHTFKMLERIEEAAAGVRLQWPEGAR